MNTISTKKFIINLIGINTIHIIFNDDVIIDYEEIKRIKDSLDDFETRKYLIVDISQISGMDIGAIELASKDDTIFKDKVVAIVGDEHSISSKYMNLIKSQYQYDNLFLFYSFQDAENFFKSKKEGQ